MKILSLLPTAIITLTITSGSVRVHKKSSKFKRSFNKIFLKKWNSKKNFKILFKEFGEGTKEVKISWINENLVDSKKAAKKAAKKLINDEFQEMLSLAKELYKELHKDDTSESEKVFGLFQFKIESEFTLTKRLMVAIRRFAKLPEYLKITKLDKNNLLIQARGLKNELPDGFDTEDDDDDAW